MNKQSASKHFNQKKATAYDQQRAKLAPIKDALHLCMRMILSGLPEDARILCVGAGTGSELIYLAQAFPHWHFTAVEPAPDMLNICRQRVKESGLSSRCTFHQGYLDTLANTDPFDAASSILVSHFIVNPDERRQFYSGIATRLKPEGYLISADLASDMHSADYKNLLSVWQAMHKYANMPVDINSFGRDVGMLAREKVASIIESSGFNAPVLFFQTLLIHAWFSRLG